MEKNIEDIKDWKITPNKEKEMVRLKREGMTNEEIGERVGYSGSAVGSHLKESLGEEYENLKLSGRKKVITPKDIKRMVKLKREGMTNKEIGERVGYTSPTIAKYLKEALGKEYEKLKLVSNKRGEISMDKKEEMVRLKREGMTNEEIGERVGYTSPTIARYLKEVLGEEYEELKLVPQSKKEIPRDKKEEIITLWKRGLTNTKISEKVGINSAKIGAFLKEEVKDYKGRRSNIKKTTRERIIALWKEGYSFKEIGEDIGLKRRTVQSAFYRHIKDLESLKKRYRPSREDKVRQRKRKARRLFKRQNFKDIAYWYVVCKEILLEGFSNISARDGFEVLEIIYKILKILKTINKPRKPSAIVGLSLYLSRLNITQKEIGETIDISMASIGNLIRELKGRLDIDLSRNSRALL